jgi:hypothetical protein
VLGRFPAHASKDRAPGSTYPSEQRIDTEERMPDGAWIRGKRIDVRRDVVILACAISAGIHGALVPDHFTDGTGAGVGFVAATVMLAALVVAMTLRPASALAFAGAAAVLAGLLVSYALATTTGLPVLLPDPEPVDGLALTTKAIEAVGLLAASGLARRPSVAVTVLQPKGT